jgi:hypothetical protein
MEQLARVDQLVLKEYKDLQDRKAMLAQVDPKVLQVL